MKRFLYFSLFLTLVFTACGGTAPTEKPADTALPPPPATDTPAPTSTPLPTDTATPVPTATIDVTATAAAQSTESASAVVTELDKVLGDSDIPYKDGHLAWQQADPITITLTGPSGNKNTLAEIPESPTAGDFIFKSDVTWTAKGWIFCGLVFRSETNINKGLQYQFEFLRFSGLPAFLIEVYDAGKSKGVLSDAQFSSAIDLGNGAVNDFMLVAQADRFTAYFNGERVGSFVDFRNQRVDGVFAFTAWQDSGQGSCKYENSWVWSLDQ